MNDDGEGEQLNVNAACIHMKHEENRIEIGQDQNQ